MVVVKRSDWELLAFVFVCLCIIAAVVCLPALAAVLAIGLWVWADQVAERRRESDRSPARPVIAEGHLPPDVVAVGVAPAPPMSYRRRTSASYRSDAAVSYRRHAASRGWRS